MKKRRFDDGGEVTGRNANIDDAARMRAMEFVRQKMAEREGLESIGASEPSAAPKATRSAPRAAARKTQSYSESPAEMQRLREQQGRAEIRRLESVDRPIERVAPELMLPPGRMLGAANTAAKALAAGRGASAAERSAALGQQAKQAVTGDRARRAVDEDRAFRASQTARSEARTARGRAKAREDEDRMAGEGPGPMRPSNERVRSEAEELAYPSNLPLGSVYRRGGKVQKYAKGGSVSSTSSASRRGDGIAQRGKTKGRMY
jgi:hypothetical protein